MRRAEASIPLAMRRRWAPERERRWVAISSSSSSILSRSIGIGASASEERPGCQDIRGGVPWHPRSRTALFGPPGDPRPQPVQVVSLVLSLIYFSAVPAAFSAPLAACLGWAAFLVK